MRTLFIFLFLTISVLLNAQTTEREVVSANGNFYSNSAGQLSTTLGEPIISTVSSSTIVLTQGFQQNNVIVEGVEDYQKDFEMNIYPNPTSNFITIKLKSLKENISFTIYTMEGKILLNQSIINLETVVNTSKFSKGNYLLHINDDNKIIKTYKIIKQ